MSLLKPPRFLVVVLLLPESPQSGSIAVAESNSSGEMSYQGHPTVNPIKLETGLRPTSAEIPYTLLLRMEAIGFPTFGLPM